MDIEISAADVKNLREEHGMSLFEARDTLIKQQLLAAVDSAKTIDELKDILFYIIKNGKVI